MEERLKEKIRKKIKEEKPWLVGAGFEDSVEYIFDRLLDKLVESLDND